MNTWLYVALCLVVPAAWGATSAWLFTQIDRRRQSSTAARRAGADDQAPPVDYII